MHDIKKDISCQDAGHKGHSSWFILMFLKVFVFHFVHFNFVLGG